jgi:hypothetical protein
VSDAWNDDDWVVGPRTSWWTPGRLFMIGLVVLVGVFAAGYAIRAATDGSGTSDDEAAEASPPATTTTTIDEPDEPQVPDEPSTDALPGGLGPVALMTFNSSATDQQIDRIRREWEASDLLFGVVVMDEDELSDNIGLDVAAITASGHEEDREALERFVCGYQDDPAVAAAGVDDICPESAGEVPDLSDLADDPDALIDDSGASLDDIELNIGFSPTATPAEIQPIRRRLERSGVFTTFEFEPRQSEFDGASISATGSSDDVEAICTLGIEAMAEFPVVDGVQLFGSNACPVL